MYWEPNKNYSLIALGLIIALAVGCGGDDGSGNTSNNSNNGSNNESDAALGDDAGDDVGEDAGGDAGGDADDSGDAAVDETAPTVEVWPAAGADHVPSDTEVRISFSEAVDPESVDTTTITLSFDGGQSSSHTVTLDEDTSIATIEFDRSAVSAPYQATVTIDGVTDLAGNAMSFEWSWTVPAWIPASVDARMYDLHYVSVDGEEYVIGKIDSTDDELVVLKQQASGWNQVASQTIDQLYDIDVKQSGGKIYIGAVHRITLIQSGKVARLYTFDPADDSISGGDVVDLGEDSNNGAVALDMRTKPDQTVASAMAVVTDGDLRVYRFLGDQLNTNTPDNFNEGYEFVRDESLSVYVHDDSLPEVIFARCANDSVPCVRTSVEQLRLNGQGAWDANPGLLRTPLHPPSSGDCDEFINFEARYAQDTATVLMAYQAPCSDPAPTIRSVEATASGWDDITQANLLDIIPDPDLHPYSAHLAFGASDQVYALAASNERLRVGRYRTSSVAWMPSVAADLDTSATVPSLKLLHPRIFMTPGHRPIVLFRQGGTTFIYRGN